MDKIVEGCTTVTDYLPDGNFLVGYVWAGESVGVYAISLPDRRCIPMVPGTPTTTVRSAPDGRSIFFAVPGEAETLVYRVKWSEGEAGEPEVAATLPFVLHRFVGGAGYDFSRDLSTFVYSRPSGQAELFYLSGVP